MLSGACLMTLQEYLDYKDPKSGQSWLQFCFARGFSFAQMTNSFGMQERSGIERPLAKLREQVNSECPLAKLRRQVNSELTCK